MQNPSEGKGGGSRAQGRKWLFQGEGTLTSSRVTGWGHEPKGADAGGSINLEIGNEGPPNQWLRSRKGGGWGFENRRQSTKYGFGEEEQKL